MTQEEIDIALDAIIEEPQIVVRKTSNNPNITFRTSGDFKERWEEWCRLNNVNKSKTIQGILEAFLEEYS